MYIIMISQEQLLLLIEQESFCNVFYVAKSYYRKNVEKNQGWMSRSDDNNQQLNKEIRIHIKHLKKLELLEKINKTMACWEEAKRMHKKTNGLYRVTDLYVIQQINLHKWTNNIPNDYVDKKLYMTDKNNNVPIMLRSSDSEFPMSYLFDRVFSLMNGDRKETKLVENIDYPNSRISCHVYQDKNFTDPCLVGLFLQMKQSDQAKGSLYIEWIPEEYFLKGAFDICDGQVNYHTNRFEEEYIKLRIDLLMIHDIKKFQLQNSTVDEMLGFIKSIKALAEKL
jgi:hypothetical protein